MASSDLDDTATLLAATDDLRALVSPFGHAFLAFIHAGASPYSVFRGRLV